MKSTVQVYIRICFLVMSLIVLLLAISCTDKPEATWRNPLDPENPETGGYPYLLTAQIADGGIQLSWNSFPELPISGFNLYRKTGDDDFVRLVQLDVLNSYTDTDVINGNRYDYYLVSFDANGLEADVSNVVTVRINTEPVFVIQGDTVVYTESRDVQLTLLAFGADKMRIANDSLFSDAEWIDYDNRPAWTLLGGEGIKKVFVQVAYDDNDTSDVVFDTIEPAPINGSVVINSGDEFTISRHVTLTMDATGVDSVFISNDEVEVISADNGDNEVDQLDEWLPYLPSMSWDLATGAGEKSVYVLFRNDFMIDSVAFDLINPEPLNPAIIINDADESTGTREVTLAISAVGAVEMELSNTPPNGFTAAPEDKRTRRSLRKQENGFNQHLSALNQLNNSSFSEKQNTALKNSSMKADVKELDEQNDWVPFSEDYDWDLATGEGEKTVYLRVKNDFEIIAESRDDIQPRLPSDYSFSIVSPDTVSRNHIIIAFRATDADSINISNTANEEDGHWIAYADTVVWDIERGPIYGAATGNNEQLRLDELDATDYSLHARFKNDFEVVSDAITDDIVVDIPSAIEINRNNEYAATRFVSLTLFSDDADEMAFDTSLVNLENDPQWRPFYINYDNYPLAYGEGTKTVYAKFRNESGAESDIVIDTIEPADINPNISVNHGADTTASTEVFIYPAGVGTDLKCMISENEDFNGAEWVEIADSISFELAVNPDDSTTTQRNIYSKIKNDFEIESDVIVHSIQTDSLYISLDIVTNYAWTNVPEVRLSMPNVRATEMKIADNPDGANAEWEAYRPSINDYALSDGDGTKHVYAWFRNEFYESKSVSDSTGLDSQVNAESFSWEGVVQEGEELTFTLTMSDDAIGAEEDGYASFSVQGMIFNYPMEDQGNGVYQATVLITDQMQAVQNAEVTANFTDRAGNSIQTVTANGLISYWVDPGAVVDFQLGNSGLIIPMVWIAPGDYAMGAYDGEQDARNEERPNHHVALDDGFWISTHEVTQEQWSAVAGYNPSIFGGNPNYPVENVSFNDVHDDFIDRLNAVDPDDAWRLPSEAEWEFAARAGTGTRFYWGDDPDSTMIDDYAWYGANSDSPNDVGSKQPNAWGLYDISGNVNEWCEDWYHDNYVGAPIDANPWLDPITTQRCARGGNFSNRHRYCRSAARTSFVPDYSAHFIGLRIVRSAL